MSIPSAPPPAGPRRVLIAGAITFVALFALIVGGSLGVRTLRSGGSAVPAATASSTAATTSDSGVVPSASATSAAWCWTDDAAQHTSTNPAGRLRGGGLEFTPPDGFDRRSSASWAPFTNDAQMAAATVEGDWVSSLTVAAVTWQEGVEYPGAEAASGRILDCMVSNGSLWEGTSQHTLEHRRATRITVDGMDGFMTTGDLMFGHSDLTRTTGTALTVIVVETPQGPSMFSAETAIGVPSHQQAERDAEDSLRAIGG